MFQFTCIRTFMVISVSIASTTLLVILVFFFSSSVFSKSPLSRPGLAALDNLADKFVAGWLLPSKVLDLSYPTPPLPLLVFAIQSDEGRQLAGRSTASRRCYCSQDGILIILEYQSIITVDKLQLWCTNSGCNTRYSKIPFTVVVESNAESSLQGSLRFFLKPVQLHQQ